MTDPKRYSDDPSAGASAARDLIAYAAATPPLTPETRARMAAGLAAKAAASAIAWWHIAAFGAGVVGVATVITAFALHAHHHANDRHAIAAVHDDVSPRIAHSTTSAPSMPLREAPAPQAAAEPPLLAPGEPSRQPPALDATRSAHVAHRDVPAVAPADPAREEALLERARQLVEQNPSGALDLLRQHASQFPHGQLMEEHQFIAVRALARLGRTDDARNLGTAFLRHYPDGIYAEPVRRLLGTLH